MQTHPTDLAAYDLERSRAHLCDRRAAWARQAGISPADHTGRRPLDGLPRPDLAPDPGPGRRSPLWLAQQYARVLAATPPFIEADDPLPGAFGWQLCDLVPGFRVDDWPAYGPADLPWGARHVGVNVGMPGHWVPDLGIGLSQGWGGLAARAAAARRRHTGQRQAYAEALLKVATAARAFVRRHAEAARALSVQANGPKACALAALAARIAAVVDQPPRTFWEAMIWLSLYMALNRAYNGANVIGRLDQHVGPLLQADLAQGRLTHGEAVLLVQSLLVHDTHFICLGGTDAAGQDASNLATGLVLEAWEGIRGPANLGLRVHPGLPHPLLVQAARLLLRTGEGTPSLVNDTAVAAGLVASGLPPQHAWSYAYGGCHWWGVPGRQYGLADGTKLNLPALLLAALERLVARPDPPPSLARLWDLVEEGIAQAYRQAARAYRLHLAEAPEAFPELLGSLLAHGPLEQGRDVFAGAVEHLCFVFDVMGLATAADGLTALARVVEQEQACTWAALAAALQGNFAGADELRARLCGSPRFGNDDPEADGVAARLRRVCLAAASAATPADGRFRILTGFYSWNAHTWAGAHLGATPDGRRAGEPLSHGANPGPGRARAGLTALARSLASIQPGTGAAAPLHLEWDPGLAGQADAVGTFLSFVEGYFALGGTQLVVNSVSRQTLEEAIAQPEAHRDLVIRVTGFSAYFVSLDPSLYPEILSRYDGT